MHTCGGNKVVVKEVRVTQIHKNKTCKFQMNYLKFCSFPRTKISTWKHPKQNQIKIRIFRRIGRNRDTTINFGRTRTRNRS